MIRTTLAALVFAAALAAPAQAVTQVIPSQGVTPASAKSPSANTTGPQLAGTTVVWAERTPTGPQNIRAKGTGPTTTVATLPEVGASDQTQLAAGGVRIAFLGGDSVYAGTLSSAFAPLLSSGAGQNVAAGDQDVVYVNGSNTIVKNFDGPDVVLGNTGTFFSAAGDYVQSAPNQNAATVDVLDRRTGSLVYEVPGTPGIADVQSDGKVAFDIGRKSAAWASPDEPFPHPVSYGPAVPPSRADTLIRMAGDRILYAAPTQLAVSDLAGNVKTGPSVPYGVNGQVDFNGTTAAFAVQPCEVTDIVTWDVDGPSPSLPTGPCPAADVSLGGKRPRGGKLAVRVRCVSKPELGCPGFVQIGGNLTFYELAPGQARTVRVRLERSLRKRLARTGRATITVRAEGNAPAVKNGKLKRRFRIRR